MWRRSGGVAKPVALGALAALVGLVVAGCAAGGGQTNAGVTGRASVSSTPPSFATGSSPAAPATATASPPRAAASTASVPECAMADLSLEIGESGGEGGSDYAPILVTNSSSAPCSTGGYFGLSLLNQHGAVEPLSVERAPGLSQSPTPPGRFTLAPGGVSGFLFEWMQGPYDPAGNACALAADIRLTPPSAASHTDLAAVTADGIAISPCGDNVSIGPLTPGPVS